MTTPGCVKEISLDPKTAEKIPVINGVFSLGGDPSVFRMSYTAPPFSDEAPYPNSGKVFFFENGEMIAESTSGPEGYCPVPEGFPGPGAPFSAICVFPEGDTLLASDTMPQAVLIYEASFSDAGIVDEYGDIIYSLNIQFLDVEGESNYYELFVFEWNDIGFTDSSSFRVFAFPYQYNAILKNEGDQDFQPWSFFFSDEIFDGQQAFFEQTFINTVVEGARIKGKPFGLEEPGTYLVFRNISRAWYEALKGWTRHRYTQRVGEGIANISDAILEDYQRVIFAPDPLPMYSNVTGGLGVFAGAHTQLIKLSE